MLPFQREYAQKNIRHIRVNRNQDDNERKGRGYGKIYSFEFARSESIEGYPQNNDSEQKSDGS